MLRAGPAERRCAHKRAIVRSFAPHLSNAALARQERWYLALGLARVLLVFAAPACAVFYLRDWSVTSPAAVVALAVSAVELFVVLHRFLLLWPEGRKRRWEYWHEVALSIELAEDTYKLKIMGYYHRKIAKYTGSFPVALSSAEIRRYYVSRGSLAFLLFVAAYAASLVLLVRCSHTAKLRVWVLYLLSVGSGLVVVRFAKLHLVELPQVLALRQHPDFSSHLVPGAASSEAIPFARPVTTYSTEPRTPDAVDANSGKHIV